MQSSSRYLRRIELLPQSVSVSSWILLVIVSFRDAVFFFKRKTYELETQMSDPHCEGRYAFSAHSAAVEGSGYTVLARSSKGPLHHEQGIEQIRWIAENDPISGSTMMEIGTGWQPMIPILFSLGGAARVYLRIRRGFAGKLRFPPRSRA